MAEHERKHVGQVEDLLKAARALLERAERSARDQHLLAQTGIELASSLDYATTLQKVARLVIAHFADWCLVDVVEEGRVQDVAVAHVDPVKEGMARSLVRKLPQLPDAPHGVARVLRTLAPELESGQHLQDHLPVDYPESLRELGARSYICAPLVARDRAIGAITFVRGAESAPYTEEDLGLANELARRAALALENALLHKELAKAVRDRDELVAFLSHDLRNLLGTVVGSAEQLRSGTKTESAIDRIRRSAERMIRLVNDMLDITRIERGVIDLDRQAREADALASDAVDAVWQVARARRVTLEPDVAPGLRVSCDATRILQVLMNLLDNAIKFSPEGSTIRIKATAADSFARFSVVDPGRGIPENELPHVFDRFWQGRHQRRAGAGLGLAITKGIVDAHGGRIWVESRAGHGTAFHFTLPLAGTASRGADVH